VAFAPLFKRDSEGVLTEVGVVNQVSEVVGQVAVMNAVPQALTPIAECLVISIAAGISNKPSPLPRANRTVLCCLYGRGEGFGQVFDRVGAQQVVYLLTGVINPVRIRPGVVSAVGSATSPAPTALNFPEFRVLLSGFLGLVTV
jgi:hypothetical protein